jgi:hypothetical protein
MGHGRSSPSWQAVIATAVPSRRARRWHRIGITRPNGTPRRISRLGRQGASLSAPGATRCLAREDDSTRWYAARTTLRKDRCNRRPLKLPSPQKGAHTEGRKRMRRATRTTSTSQNSGLVPIGLGQGPASRWSASASGSRSGKTLPEPPKSFGSFRSPQSQSPQSNMGAQTSIVSASESQVSGIPGLGDLGKAGGPRRWRQSRRTDRGGPTVIVAILAAEMREI